MEKSFKKKEKGITLVALVVTIVVLLILAGVSINLVLGENGLVNKAKEAKIRTMEEQENTLNGMNSLSDEIEHAINENEKKIKIGDYVNYTYDSSENYTYNDEEKKLSYDYPQTQNLQWRIIKIDNDNITLASSSTTDTMLELANEYSHSADVLIAEFENLENLFNSICKKHYSNKSLSVEARSIVYDDYTTENAEVLADIQNQYFFATSVIEKGNNDTHYQMYFMGAFNERVPDTHNVCYGSSYQNQTWGSVRKGYLVPVVTIPISKIAGMTDGVWQIQ